MVDGDEGLEATLAQGEDYLPVMLDRRAIHDAVLGLDPAPLEREPVRVLVQ